MRKNSVKNTRINNEVQKVLAETIRGEIKDPRIAPLTSVVAVEVAPDLKTCKAWISVLGDKKAQDDTLAGLKSASGFNSFTDSKMLVKSVSDNKKRFSVMTPRRFARSLICVSLSSPET